MFVHSPFLFLIGLFACKPNCPGTPPPSTPPLRRKTVLREGLFPLPEVPAENALHPCMLYFKTNRRNLPYKKAPSNRRTGRFMFDGSGKVTSRPFAWNSTNRHSCGSRNPVLSRLSGFPLEFTPYLIRGGNDKMGVFFTSFPRSGAGTITVQEACMTGKSGIRRPAPHRR